MGPDPGPRALLQALRAEAAREAERHHRELAAAQQLEAQLQERADLARVARVSEPAFWMGEGAAQRQQIQQTRSGLA